MNAYDIIGDLHGQAGKLEALLGALGYQHRQGAWRHRERQALFVGDFIDRGPRQIDCMDIVRRMKDAGSARAVLGNHEYNAIAWHTPDPLSPGEYLRKHTEKNHHQHAAYLAQVGEGSRQHAEWTNWFLTLPMWLDLPGLRVVHACWHDAFMKELAPWLRADQSMRPELVEASSREGSRAYKTAEVITKGLEIALPNGVSYRDAEGTVRTRTRTRWWDETADTCRSSALIHPDLAWQLPETPLPKESLVRYDQAKPLFFGHYWFTGTPSVLGPKFCCVDYSAARNAHPLVAYRWDGEPELDAGKLVAVGAELPHPAKTPRP
jgi:hypothetical protein